MVFLPKIFTWLADQLPGVPSVARAIVPRPNNETGIVLHISLCSAADSDAAGADLAGDSYSPWWGLEGYDSA